MCRSGSDDNGMCALLELMKNGDAGGIDDAGSVGYGLENAGSSGGGLVDGGDGSVWAVHVDVADGGDNAGAVHLEWRKTAAVDLGDSGAWVVYLVAGHRNSRFGSS